MPCRKVHKDGTVVWEARVQLEGTTTHLGTFPTEEAADRTQEDFKAALRQITREAHLWWLQEMRSSQQVTWLHMHRALEYFSHTHISPPDHAKDLARRALAGERIWEL